MYGPNFFSGNPMGPQSMAPNNAYPVFIPMPQTESETTKLIKLLKAARKEQDGGKKKEDPKKEEKKPDVMSYLQRVAIAFAITPFVMLANALAIITIIRMFKGI